MKITDDTPRISADEIAVLKAMFEEREGAVEVIRKIFYPELAANNPIHANKDMYIDILNLDGLSSDQKVIAVEAHQKLVRHVESCLGVIRMLVGRKDETPEQVLKRLRQDSSK